MLLHGIIDLRAYEAELSLHEKGETVDPEFNESLIITTDP